MEGAGNEKRFGEYDEMCNKNWMDGRWPREWKRAWQTKKKRPGQHTPNSKRYYPVSKTKAGRKNPQPMDPQLAPFPDTDRPPELPSPFEEARSKALAQLSDGHHLPILPPHLESQATSLRDLLLRTIDHSESLSFTLTGPQGCGKTLVLDHVLSSLADERGSNGRLRIVRLSGNIHGEPAIALRSITHQLLTPDSIARASATVFGSFAESLGFLISLLRRTASEDVSIIFVLDKLEAFTRQPKQTLLYTLTDMLTAARMAIVGVTFHLDVVELFEKRIRSRFSNRQILFLDSVPVPAMMDELLTAVVVPDGGEWNNQARLTMSNPATIKAFEELWDVGQDWRVVRAVLASGVGKSYDGLSLTAVLSAVADWTGDVRMDVLKGLSMLDLSLLVALERLRAQESKIITFSMAYQVYVTFCKSDLGRSMDCFSEPVALKVFEHLIELGLVRPVDGSRHATLQFRHVRLIVPSGEVEAAVLTSRHPCPTALRQWACGWRR